MANHLKDAEKEEDTVGELPVPLRHYWDKITKPTKPCSMQKKKDEARAAQEAVEKDKREKENESRQRHALSRCRS